MRKRGERKRKKKVKGGKGRRTVRDQEQARDLRPLSLGRGEDLISQRMGVAGPEEELNRVLLLCRGIPILSSASVKRRSKR